MNQSANELNTCNAKAHSNSVSAEIIVNENKMAKKLINVNKYLVT